MTMRSSIRRLQYILLEYPAPTLAETVQKHWIFIAEIFPESRVLSIEGHFFTGLRSANLNSTLSLSFL